MKKEDKQTIWVACESCIIGNGKRALFYATEPRVKDGYKPNDGEHGKWEGFSPMGWYDGTTLPIEIGECKEFSLELTGKCLK